jgi:fatty acid desaturase
LTNKERRRDYRLNGAETPRAFEKGLVQAQWYETEIPRARFKELMKRSDGPAIRDTLIWFALIGLTGYLAVIAWEAWTWWTIPAFLLYGLIYATPSDSRWHECGHGTAFKTPWMNEVVYQIATFMVLRAPTPWKWSHARHHSDTYIVGRDPEIASPRPPIYVILWLEIVHLYGGTFNLKKMMKHCFGIMDEQEKDYVPESEYRKTFWEARIHTLIYLIVIFACIWRGDILPALLIGLPRFYGSFLMLLFGLTQHIGMYEDVLDHRLNTRSFYTNRIFRFLYWNMNYHIEHHMFPMVPYHALPKLHEEVKHDYPQTSPSLYAALKETFQALWIQRKDSDYVVEKSLPATAKPYRFGPAYQSTKGS